MATLLEASIKPKGYERYSKWTPEHREGKVKGAARAAGGNFNFFTERAYEEGPLSLAKMAFQASSKEIRDLRIQAGTTRGEWRWRWHWDCACLMNIGLKRLLLPMDDRRYEALLRFGRDCFSDVYIDSDAETGGSWVNSARLRNDLNGSGLSEYLAAFVKEFEQTSGYDANWADLFRIFLQDQVAAHQGVRHMARDRAFQEHLWLVKKVIAFCFANKGDHFVNGDHLVLHKGAEWRVYEINNNDAEAFFAHIQSQVPIGSWAPGVLPTGLEGGGGAMSGAREDEDLGAREDEDIDSSEDYDANISRVDDLVRETAIKALQAQTNVMKTRYTRQKTSAEHALSTGREREADLESQLKECKEENQKSEEKKAQAEERLKKLDKYTEDKVRELSGAPKGEDQLQTPERKRQFDGDETEDEGE
eukprot:CAMPEP_0169446360 /NCGR_PEP_ID=MMETSP1042-20121227/10934_1 /TAXON_ID=464988 /ORGANISM="Hemiselmis andersenii, Strain CCMP1180" /LENGTH=418 /DNA_ID=CAMNT_0009557823 /DNA_START=55 /DNA_END=1308 /DNA_ORIENTATION=-